MAKASYMSQKNRFGYAACASLLREQGLAAVPRLAMYAHKDAAVCWYKLTIRKSSAPCC